MAMGERTRGRRFGAMAAMVTAAALAAAALVGTGAGRAAAAAVPRGSVRVVVEEDYGKAEGYTLSAVGTIARAMLRGVGLEVVEGGRRRADASLVIRVTGEPLWVYAREGVSVGRQRPLYTGAKVRGTITLESGERRQTVEFAGEKPVEKKVAYVRTGPVSFQTRHDTPQQAPFVEALTASGFVRRLAEAVSRFWNVEMVTPLAGLLEHGDMYERVWAMDALAEVGASGVEPLVAALGHESSLVRSKAARALWRIGDARAVGPLLERLKDEDAEVRSEAAVALGRLGDASAAGPLLEAARDEHAIVRSKAMMALGQLGVAEAIDTLLMATLDERPLVRDSASQALASLGEAAVPALRAALQNANPMVRAGARQALVRIGKAMVPMLMDMLANGPQYLKMEASIALGDIGDAAAVDLLVGALESDDAYVATFAHQALVKLGEKASGALVPLLKSEKELIRSRAARVLAQIGAPAIDDVMEAVRDTGWPTEQRVYAANVLFLMKKQAVPTLMKGLADEDPLIRWTSAVSLGLMREREALEQIERMAEEDPDAQVRRHAKNSVNMYKKAGEPSL